MILPQTNQFLPSFFFLSFSLLPLPFFSSLPPSTSLLELSGYAGYFIPPLTFYSILLFYFSSPLSVVWTVLCFFFPFPFFLFLFFFIIIIFFFYLPFSSSSGTPGLFCASRPIWMSLRSWLALCRQVSCEVLIPVCGGGGGCRKLTGLFSPRFQMVRHVPMPNNSCFRRQRSTLYVSLRLLC